MSEGLKKHNQHQIERFGEFQKMARASAMTPRTEAWKRLEEKLGSRLMPGLRPKTWILVDKATYKTDRKGRPMIIPAVYSERDIRAMLEKEMRNDDPS
jgi:hypothetical protein